LKTENSLEAKGVRADIIQVELRTDDLLSIQVLLPNAQWGVTYQSGSVANILGYSSWGNIMHSFS